MEKHLTATEAARRLGVSLQTVLRRIQSGAIRAERAGQRLWLISEAEVERIRNGTHDRRAAASHDAAAVSDGESAATLLEKPRLLTRESLARLDEMRRGLRDVRLPLSSTELLRREREERSRELARRHGISIDEPDLARGG